MARSSARTIPVLAAIALVGILGTWLLSSQQDAPMRDTGTVPPAADRQLRPPDDAALSPPAPPEAPAPEPLRLAPHQRQQIDHAALPTEGPLRLTLDLDDAMRGDGSLEAIVVSAAGRRMELRTTPRGDHGVELALDPGALEPGRYLIHLKVKDKHPLSFRRYVFELR